MEFDDFLKTLIPYYLKEVQENQGLSQDFFLLAEKISADYQDVISHFFWTNLGNLDEKEDVIKKYIVHFLENRIDFPEEQAQVLHETLAEGLSHLVQKISFSNAIQRLFIDSDIFNQHFDYIYTIHATYPKLLSAIEKYWLKDEGDAKHCPLEGRLFFEKLLFHGQEVDKEITELIQKKHFYKNQTYRASSFTLFQVLDHLKLKYKVEFLEAQVKACYLNKALFPTKIWETWQKFWRKLRMKNKKEVQEFICVHLCKSLVSMIKDVAEQRANGLNLCFIPVETQSKTSLNINYSTIIRPSLIRVFNQKYQTTDFYFLRNKNYTPRQIKELHNSAYFSELKSTTDLWFNDYEHTELYACLAPIYHTKEQQFKSSIFSTVISPRASSLSSSRSHSQSPKSSSRDSPKDANPVKVSRSFNLSASMSRLRSYSDSSKSSREQKELEPGF